MDFRLYWIGLGILLFIVEMFIMSFDALALGIAAFVTGALSYFLGIDMANWHLSGIIFLVASVIALMIARMLIAPKLHGDTGVSPMSGDTIIGKTFKVQKVNKRDVIKYEGMYRNIKSDESYNIGDKVTVLNIDDNVATVEK